MPWIDQTSCISCGLCARVCSVGVITYEAGAPVVHQERSCMSCWHCAAVCPQKAVREEGLDLYPPIPGDPVERAVTLRRSARHFLDQPPAREVISRALHAAAWSATGRNDRGYAWTVLYGKPRVQELLALVLAWAENTPRFKVFTKLVRHGQDPVTCGASCVLFGHSTDEVSNPQTDTVIAATTAELLLFQQGVGTCWGGYLCRAVNACDEAKAFLGIPPERTVYAVLLAGLPDREPYCNVPYRPEPQVDWK